ncbi:MAG TPA: flagellar basal body-associated FliL family protein [Allosphingosinicella sp.]|jgi:flagellar FliL protein|nr:flagellar basal body-associated FliL family protein [Allosphingosinicella sp.]
MSDTEKAPPPRKKGKGKKLIVVGGAVLLLGGGGAGAAAYAGIGPFGHHGKSDPDRPHLVPRSGTSEAEIERYDSPAGDAHPDPGKFEASYYPLHDNFTANLRDGGQFVQVGLGVSTYYDQRVLDAVKLHEMAVRSAVLLTLNNQSAATLSTPQGKEQLKDQLRKAINDVLKKKEGFGGIDDVYFTSLVVQ